MDGKRYATHAEVLNKLFGKSCDLWVKATYDLDNGYSVWFPVVSRTTNKNSPLVKTADNKWINLLIKNDTEIHQYWPQTQYASAELSTHQIRITFAKFYSGRKYWYEFIGVFEKIQNAPDHTVYKRIATQYPLP